MAISSHSQHRRGQLKAIAHNGNVYAVEKNLYRALKQRRKKYTSWFIKMPISKASVFPGYCSKHDAMIFGPIEKAPLDVGNKEQAVLLFLRANSFEYLQKKSIFTWDNYFLDMVGNQLSAKVRDNYALKMYGIAQYLTYDAPYYFEESFKSLTMNNYSGIESAWIEIPKNIQVSVSCCISPLMYMHIDYMEENHHEIQPSVTFSVVPNSQTTHVVVTWLKKHSDLASWFHDALKDESELKFLINQCIFGESEDTCISPVLWESLSEEERNMVTKAVGFTRELEVPAPLPKVVKL